MTTDREINSAPPRPSFWRRRLIDPLVSQLKQGISPSKLAQSLAWGGLLGIFPVLGTTTTLCAVFALWLRLNHIAIQAVNWLVYPLQILLIVPFLKMGNWMFGFAQTSLSLSAIRDSFQQNFMGALHDYGWLALRGVAAWLVVALPLVLLISRILTPVVGRLSESINKSK